MTWHEHAPDVVVDVACAGGLHRVRWTAGDLVLEDHDVEAEEVLAALGGEIPACLSVLALWRDAVADGGFVEEWATDRVDGARRAWLRTALRRLRAEGVQDLLPGLPPRRAERMGAVLTTLAPGLQDRAAVAAAERALAAGAPFVPLVRHTARAVQVRVRQAFVASLAPWRQLAPTAALVPLRCQTRFGTQPMVEGRLAGRDSYCDLVLDVSWLVDVWGRGLAVAGGHLVVAVDGGGGGGGGGGGEPSAGADVLEVQAVRWEHGSALPGRVARTAAATVWAGPDGAWRLEWSPTDRSRRAGTRRPR